MHIHGVSVAQWKTTIEEKDRELEKLVSCSSAHAPLQSSTPLQRTENAHLQKAHKTAATKAVTMEIPEHSLVSDFWIRLCLTEIA